MTAPVTDIGAAIDAFLSELRDQLGDRSARFRALVARDLVRQLQAESIHGEQLATIRQAPCWAFGTDSTEALARAIRDGEVDAGEARRRLLASAARELRIVRPSFDTSRDLP